jgi:hypothetical protein
VSESESESESGNHCCPSPVLFTEPNRLTLNKPESESKSESESVKSEKKN